MGVTVPCTKKEWIRRSKRTKRRETVCIFNENISADVFMSPVRIVPLMLA